MKFDVVIGNYPFQELKEGNKKSKAMWQLFVKKSFELCKRDGFVCAIHPSGWRDVSGMFKKTQEIIKSKNVKYLEVHDRDEGVETFGVQTAYDWYIVKNSPIKESTRVRGYDKKEYDVNIYDMDFIPNGRFDAISNLMAKEGEEKVELLHSYSAYETRKPHMSREKGTVRICNMPFIPNAQIDKVMSLVAKDGEEKVELLWDCKYHTQARTKDGTMSREKKDKFKYPCIQHVNVKGQSSCTWYSATNRNGHFTVPKVIFSSQQVGGTMVDLNGNYGMCQHCSAIVDSPKTLSKIKEAMDSSAFIEIMKSCDVGGNRDRYNRKVIALFRKDFWKEFI